jgi:Cu-Zn family superoxide dismutase
MRLYEVTTPGKCPRTKAKVCECKSVSQLSEAEQTIEAVAVLGHGDAKGMISFKQKPGKATIISGTITGLSEGKHGFHIHEFGDLSDGCDSAGGHYNPTGVDHGDIDNGHVGDLGNITADSKGVAEFSIKAKRIHLQGATSIVGRAVVVHEDEDDLGKGGDEESLKTGNAGERAGCGVISLTELTESAIEDLDKNISDKHFSRSEMPQVKEPDLEDNDISYVRGIISLDKIKPVQTDRVPGLAQKVAKNFHGKDKPFILDKNNYLVNGHHRYDAARLLGIDRVSVLKVDVPIELLMKKFSHTRSNAVVEDVVGMNPQAVKPYFSPQEADRANDEWVNQAQVDQEDGVIVKATDGKQYRIMTSYGNQHFEDGEVYLDGVTDPEYLDTDGYPDAAELLYYHSATGHYPEEDYEVAENYKSQDVTKQGRNLSAKVKQYLKGKKTELTTVKVSNLDMDTPGFDRIIGDLGDVNFADTTDPIVVDADGKTILDGFHRVQKAKEIGKDEIPAYMVIENFADGKKKGKSRPGRVKRAGASCNGSVTALRKRAKNSSGEKAKMYHWCANMKSGKKKANEDMENMDHLDADTETAKELIDGEIASGKITNIDEIKQAILQYRLARIIRYPEDARALWKHYLEQNHKALQKA